MSLKEWWQIGTLVFKKQQYLWGPDGENYPRFGNMSWPSAFLTRITNHRSVAAVPIIDSAQPDYPVGREYVTHKSGIHGSVSGSERLKVRLEHTFTQLSTFIENE